MFFTVVIFMVKKLKKLLSYPAIAALAFMVALNYVLFVFPNKFAPAGIDGICTMIQDALHVNMGYLSLLINIPLLIAAFIVLNREFAVKNLIFTLAFSLSIVFFEKVDLKPFLYVTETGSSTVFAPVVAGTIRGILYVAALNLNGAAGGIDVISALIKHKKPHLDLMNIIFAINMLIAVTSFFVYGNSVEPVICSIVYSFVTSTVCSKIRSTKNETVKFEIITQNPEQLCTDIIHKLHQKATIIDALGAFSKESTKVVLCIVEKETAPFVEELLLQYSNSTVFKSFVNASISGLAYK